MEYVSGGELFDYIVKKGRVSSNILQFTYLHFELPWRFNICAHAKIIDVSALISILLRLLRLVLVKRKWVPRRRLFSYSLNTSYLPCFNLSVENRDASY